MKMSDFAVAVLLLCTACGSAPAAPEQEIPGDVKAHSQVNTARADKVYSVVKAGNNSEEITEKYIGADDVVRTADERYVEYLEEPKGRKARCLFDGEPETCAFVPAPDGSFKIMTVSGGGYDFKKVGAGIVDVTFYGAKPNPLGNFTWNNEDKACWDGADQQICIY